ncbi:MAG: thiamine-binding protein [Proteobacteria bacterium]|nr:thiamine-binding protein [Pseudomonadota bacterium]
MRVAVDISLYPLDQDFLTPIRDVIERLNAYSALEVITNSMSTQIRGEYDDVMAALSQEIRVSFERTPKAVFVIKILNNPLGDQTDNG